MRRVQFLTGIILSTLFVTSTFAKALTPNLKSRLHYQLGGTKLKNYSKASYVGVDLFEGTRATVDKLHKEGRYVICYFSAGTAENYRSDYKSFPKAALGKKMPEWPDEQWLDIRHSGVMAVHKKRLDKAVALDCDGVDPDNVDGYSNNTGFKITQEDEKKFLKTLAAEARARGLDIGLKNATDIAASLATTMDWIIVEECFKYKECDKYAAFPKAGKAAFLIEYTKYSQKQCDAAKKLNMNLMFSEKDYALKGPFKYCN